VWATLRTFAADPTRLDGQLGMTAALHTWGQTLTRHVHLHCLVPGGFVSRLRQTIYAGRLPRIEDRAQIDAVLDALMAADWLVYS
jgi:hypothetical protein